MYIIHKAIGICQEKSACKQTKSTTKNKSNEIFARFAINRMIKRKPTTPLFQNATHRNMLLCALVTIGTIVYSPVKK